MQPAPKFPADLLALLFPLAVILGIFGLMLLPAGSFKTKAKIAVTRTDERNLAALLENAARQSNGLTNVDANFIAAAVFTPTNSLRFRTNDFGMVCDAWQVPFEIKLLDPTHFSIRSAGKNKIPGDRDDIIFNSLLNDFVKP